MKRFIAIIPARYASTRFPGKPLAVLAGKPVVQRVYEQVASVMPKVVVATDDDRIRTAVEDFGGEVVMTSSNHRSGTDRVNEAYHTVLATTGRSYDVVVNVQGDEPFIHASQLLAVQQCFDDPTTQIATLVKPFDAASSIDVLLNPNSPKVVVDNNMFALYFSRSIIPYLRGVEQKEWLCRHTFYKHIGLYAYRSQVLDEITSLPQSDLEIAESLEQLRWLQAGYKIKTAVTDIETIGIDTADDLMRAEQFLASVQQKMK